MPPAWPARPLGRWLDTAARVRRWRRPLPAPEFSEPKFGCDEQLKCPARLDCGLRVSGFELSALFSAARQFFGLEFWLLEL